jgi:hypothetical protein
MDVHDFMLAMVLPYSVLVTYTPMHPSTLTAEFCRLRS